MNKELKRIAIIMAGGQGERFWPKSRRKMPKQFLSLTEDGKTLFQGTVERMLQLCDIEDIFVVTNRESEETVQQQALGIPYKNILCEPCGRNTAPAIAFAAGVIKKRYGNATMIIVPSDHVIKGMRLFKDIMIQASIFAQKENALVTLGITPTHPDTAYGYIDFGEKVDGEYQNVYKVNAFVEKPNIVEANKYISKGTFLWNSGMFIWSLSTLIECLNRYTPNLAQMVEEICEITDTPRFDVEVGGIFNEIESVSIDYALMEKATNIYTIPSSFLWSDVGSWDSLSAISKLDKEDNISIGNIIYEDCKNSTFVSAGRLIASVGLDSIIVVETKDAILVCNKNSAQDVKKLVEQLKTNNMNEYL